MIYLFHGRYKTWQNSLTNKLWSKTRAFLRLSNSQTLRLWVLGQTETIVTKVSSFLDNFSYNMLKHRLRTPGEEIALTARPKINSQSQIFRYGQSIFCLPHRPKFSDFFDLCLYWVSVVRVLKPNISLQDTNSFIDAKFGVFL